MARTRGATTIGNTRGGRGPLPSNIRNMSDYYNAGYSSPSNPSGVVRNQSGQALNRPGAKS